MQVLQAETLSSMHTPAGQSTRQNEQIGLSWFIDDVAGTRQLSHGGGTMGQVSLLALFPGAPDAAGWRADQRGRGRRDHGRRPRWVLEHYLGLEVPKPEPIEAIGGGPGRFCGIL